ncbi:MAG: hypothetical protein AB1505_27410 [Candidatus Latescibacterota bacterium]
MRYFAGQSRLAGMEFHTRLITTYFLVLVLVATAASVLLAARTTGASAAGAAAYYRGDGEGMLFPKEPAELLETAHFHLFAMPLIFLTTGHLFLLTAWPARVKGFVITSCFAYIALDVAKPWLVRYAGPAWGVLAPVNSALLGGTMLVCILVPLYEMWLLPSRPQPGPPEP